MTELEENKKKREKNIEQLIDVFNKMQQKKGNEQSLINTIKKELLYA